MGKMLSVLSCPGLLFLSYPLSPSPPHNLHKPLAWKNPKSVITRAIIEKTRSFKTVRTLWNKYKDPRIIFVQPRLPNPNLVT